MVSHSDHRTGEEDSPLSLVVVCTLSSLSIGSAIQTFSSSLAPAFFLFRLLWAAILFNSLRLVLFSSSLKSFYKFMDQNFVPNSIVITLVRVLRKLPQEHPWSLVEKECHCCSWRHHCRSWRHHRSQGHWYQHGWTQMGLSLNRELSSWLRFPPGRRAVVPALHRTLVTMDLGYTPTAPGCQHVPSFASWTHSDCLINTKAHNKQTQEYWAIG